MKYIKTYEYYSGQSAASFLASNTVSMGENPNTGGIASANSAGTGGKKQREAGPSSFGPDMKNYDKVEKYIKGERIRKKKKKSKKIIRDHPGNK